MDDSRRFNKRSTFRKSIRVPVIYGTHEDESRGVTQDLSESGLSIISDKDFDIGTRVDVGLVLDKDLFNSQAVVRHIYANHDNRAVGLEFLGLNEHDKINLRQALDFPFGINVIDYNNFPYSLNLNPINHKVISDKNFISYIFNQHHVEKQPIYIKPHLRTVSFPSLITSIGIIGNKNCICINLFEDGSAIDLSEYRELILFFVNRTRCYVFKAVILHMNRLAVYLELPEAIIQLLRRPHPKMRLDVSGRNIIANVISGLDGKEYRMPVRDIGFGGLSVDLPDRNLVPEIEKALLRISFKLDNDMDVSIIGDVKYTDERFFNDKMIYTSGLKINWIDREHGEKLNQYIFRHYYPYMVEIDETSIEKVWELFFKSGYMIPEKNDYVNKVKNTIEDTWAKVYGKDSKIGIMLYFKDNGKIYGTISAVKAYQNTWVIHQLAALLHPKIIIGIYQIECIILLMLNDYLNFKYGKVYFRKKNSWAIEKLFKFHEMSTLKDSVLFIFMDLYEYEITDKDQTDYADSNIKIEYLSDKEEIDVIIDHLTKTLPEIVIQTDSLNYQDLELNDIMKEFNRIGLQRGRKILIARSNGKIISFALIEYGSTGINLGGLLDVFQLFTIDESHENLKTINQALIEESVRFYQSIGKKTAQCMSNDKYKDILENAGFIKKLEFIIWYMKKSGAAQIYHEFNNNYLLARFKN